MTVLFQEKAQALKPMLSPFEEAVRKDSAVHVSLSSDSPVKQPGNLAVASPQPAEAYCRADEAGPPTTSRGSDPHVSEELQARHHAD